jgi:hypothetical protein
MSVKIDTENQNFNEVILKIGAFANTDLMS